jgi:hypothetical protein
MRLKSLIIFGVGYIWGTRAGRDRFDALTERFREVLASDVLRDYVEKARARAVISDSHARDAPEEGLAATAQDVAGDQDETEDESTDEGVLDLDEEDEGYGPEDDEESEEEEPDEEAGRVSRRAQIRRRAPARRRRQEA